MADGILFRNWSSDSIELVQDARRRASVRWRGRGRDLANHLVKCRSLQRQPARVMRDVLQLGGCHCLAMVCTGSTRDTLFRQRSSETIGTIL